MTKKVFRVYIEGESREDVLDELLLMRSGIVLSIHPVKTYPIRKQMRCNRVFSTTDEVDAYLRKKFGERDVGRDKDEVDPSGRPIYIWVVSTIAGFGKVRFVQYSKQIYLYSSDLYWRFDKP